MYTKTVLFNLASNMLLLQREFTNADEDTVKEAKVLRTVWLPSLYSALEELNLNRTMQTATLELLAEAPNDLWDFAYKYPANCAFLRRIVSSVRRDDESTLIDKGTGTIGSDTVIFTDEAQASIEYIPKDLPLTSLNTHAGLFVAARLAFMAAPLLMGKGAAAIRKSLKEDSALFKFEAQQMDTEENTSYESPAKQSGFVRARLE